MEIMVRVIKMKKIALREWRLILFGPDFMYYYYKSTNKIFRSNVDLVK